MNQDAPKYEWIDAKDVPDEHKRRIALLGINRAIMHRENELRQRKFFRGCYPDVGLSDTLLNPY